MDQSQWPHGAGEIPARPEPTIDPRIQAQAIPTDRIANAGIQLNDFAQAPTSHEINYATAPLHNGASAAPTPLPGESRKSRADILAMRRQEREIGVPFWLKNTKMHARVRDLPFTDRIMLDGIPADMRVAVDKTIGIVTNMTTGQVGSALKLLGDISDLNDAFCIAGFIWPKLVRTEDERQAELRAGKYSDNDVWLVGDLDSDEKGEYRDWAFKDRGDGEREDTARLASFPDAGVAEAPDSQDRESGQPTPLRSTEDGGIGLRA